jgi:hypothetical protein
MRIIDIFDSDSKRRVFPKEIPEDIEWKEDVFETMDCFEKKYYDVYSCRHPDGLYLKARKPYECGHFEELFGFGCCCSGFFEKVILLKN